MELDEPDQAYVLSLIPEGAIPTAIITVVAFLNPESGDMQWKVHNDTDVPLSHCLGLLDLAKLDLCARTPGNRLYLEPDDDA